MIELGVGGDVLRAIGGLYLFAAIGVFLAAVLIPRTTKVKVILGALVIVAFSAPVAEPVYKQYEFMSRYRPAKAVFEAKCKDAGERIYKTIEDVEAVLLLKVRPPREEKDLKDPMWPSAALSKESTGDEYIKNFLIDRPVAGSFVESVDGPGLRGYRYADVINPANGQRYRYRAKEVDPSQKENRGHRVRVFRELADAAAPRYAITYQDNVDPALRKHWVAGTVIQVVDTETGAVLGEREVWKFDDGLGYSRQRAPWIATHQHCPRDKGYTGFDTHDFVNKVLLPRQGK